MTNREPETVNGERQMARERDTVNGKQPSVHPGALVCALGAVAVAAVISLGVYHPKAYTVPPKKPTLATTTDASPVLASLSDLAIKDPKRAETEYHGFIEAHKTDPDPKVQDQVGEARIRTAYLAADRKDYQSARTTFLQAATEYKGTGESGDFGGVKDGAEYQAAVCLMAEGKKADARAAFTYFLKNEPTSPLARAAYRRLVMLNNGVSRHEDEALLNKDIAVQEKKANLERVSCGPRSIQILLRLLGKSQVSVEQLAKFCQTGKDGTTMAGMHEGLMRLGIKTYGVRLNRHDFIHAQTPAIMLTNGHYTVLTNISDKSLTYIDPISASQDEVTVPMPGEGSDFAATLLLLSPPNLAGLR